MGWRAAFISVLILPLVLLAGRVAQAQQEPAVLLEQHAHAGTLSKAEAALAAELTRQPANAETRFALGLAQTGGAVERFAQDLYRYGLKPARIPLLPILALPVPPNPAPEAITYAAFREMLARFVRDLDAAEATLAGLGDAPVKLSLDMARVRLDINRNGVGEDNEMLAAMLAGPGRPSRGAGGAPGFRVSFDTADALWLRGYCTLVAGFAEFFLAHDFETTFDLTFHQFFPASDLPFQKILDEGRQREIRPGHFAPETGSIADAIAFVHLIHWPVVEPVRMQGIQKRLKSVVALSRKSWASAMAETDDDNEWLPNPRQKGVLTGLPVTDEIVKGWLAVLDQFEQMLDGKLMVPHWRMQRGFNLARVFAEPRPFDLVLMVTGQGIVPYLADGPVARRADWEQAISVFRGNFLGYAFYFN